MKKCIFILILFMSFLFSSCDELFSFFESQNVEISEEDVIKGLKTALEIGTDTAVTKTSVTDGYYGNAIIKIFLPKEADIIVNNMNKPLLKNLGIPEMVESVILKINRAAEEAAKKATPIFFNAIKNMTFDEALQILYGINPSDTLQQNTTFDSTAATKYLKLKTYLNLELLFKPVMDSALNEKLIGNISAMVAWNTLIDTYNTVAENELLGGVLDLKKVNTDLSKHVTGKGLDGLFYMISIEEIKIRKDPQQWTNNIIQQIFGFVQDNPDITKVTLN